MALSSEETGALELFMNALRQPALLSDRTLTCTDCNEAMCRSLGLSREEVIGHKLEEILDPATSKSRQKYAQEVVDTGEERWFEDTRGDRCFSIRMAPTRDAQGLVNGLALYATDVSKEKAAGQFAAAAEARYKRIIETCLEGVWQIDEEHKTCFVNEQMAAMLGYTVDEFMGKSMYDFMDDEAVALAEENVQRRQQGIEESHDFRLCHKQGHDVWTAMSTNPVQDEKGAYVGALALVTDITEQRQMEQRLQQAQKLEGLSVLAGGVAHDFNNVLSVILGNAELMRSKAASGKSIDESLSHILSATQRATELTSQMLAFSGRARFEAEPIDLNQVTKEAVALFANTIGESTGLDCELATAASIISADPVQIRQMLMSLLNNASDAIGSDRPGIITVATGLRTLSKEALAQTILDHELVPGPHAFLKISDDGHGMGAETMGRLFEPFFSTRFAGRGLGMAVVLGILRSHRAGIYIDSSLESGSTFEIVFPLGAGLPVTPLAAAEDVRQAALVLPGKVVVVDDDPMVLDAVCGMLRALGQEVLAYQGGKLALDGIATCPDPIALAIVDMTMPGMSGAALHAQLRALYPLLPIVLSSGYSQDDSSSVDSDDKTAFLKKPYGASALQAVVEKVTQN